MIRKLTLGVVLCVLACVVASCGGGSQDAGEGTGHWGELTWDEAVWR